MLQILLRITDSVNSDPEDLKAALHDLPEMLSSERLTHLDFISKIKHVTSLAERLSASFDRYYGVCELNKAHLQKQLYKIFTNGISAKFSRNPKY
mmetsp:Transcript_21244/g.32909  ORF Transcript_21244/g.32909 Transcript_21244/m.32909 type:complete len:95 (+) Transcript_21244:707-991(+)